MRELSYNLQTRVFRWGMHGDQEKISRFRGYLRVGVWSAVRGPSQGGHGIADQRCGSHARVH
jgi:hypothetical protein